MKHNDITVQRKQTETENLFRVVGTTESKSP